MIEIAIEGRLSRELGLTRRELKAAATYFAERSAERIGAMFRQVTIILQNDAESAEVHLAINGAEGPTDVITQRYDPMPGEADGVYGELYVNIEQAFRYPKKCRNWSAAKELLLFVAHGMDHLSGADDLDAAGYNEMRRRELSWLKALD